MRTLWFFTVIAGILAVWFSVASPPVKQGAATDSTPSASESVSPDTVALSDVARQTQELFAGTQPEDFQSEYCQRMQRIFTTTQDIQKKLKEVAGYIPAEGIREHIEKCFEDGRFCQDAAESSRQILDSLFARENGDSRPNITPTPDTSFHKVLSIEVDTEPLSRMEEGQEQATRWFKEKRETAKHRLDRIRHTCKKELAGGVH